MTIGISVARRFAAVRRRVSRGNDNIDLEINELRSQRRQTIQLPFRSSHTRLHILTVDVAELPEFPLKISAKWFGFFTSSTPSFAGFVCLCMHDERPRSRRAREHYDEIAPLSCDHPVGAVLIERFSTRLQI